jgi:hypothetical protein
MIMRMMKIMTKTRAPFPYLTTNGLAVFPISSADLIPLFKPRTTKLFS